MEKKETKRILKTIEYYYSDGKEHKRCPVCGIDPVKLEQELDKAREEVADEVAREIGYGKLSGEEHYKTLNRVIKLISKLKDNK